MTIITINMKAENVSDFLGGDIPFHDFPHEVFTRGGPWPNSLANVLTGAEFTHVKRKDDEMWLFRRREDAESFKRVYAAKIIQRS